MACAILVPQPGIEPKLLSVEAWSLNLPADLQNLLLFYHSALMPSFFLQPSLSHPPDYMLLMEVIGTLFKPFILGCQFSLDNQEIPLFYLHLSLSLFKL